jgi:hypothetical protein
MQQWQTHGEWITTVNVEERENPVCRLECMILSILRTKDLIPTTQICPSLYFNKSKLSPKQKQALSNIITRQEPSFWPQPMKVPLNQLHQSWSKTCSQGLPIWIFLWHADIGPSCKFILSHDN